LFFKKSIVLKLFTLIYLVIQILFLSLYCNQHLNTMENIAIFDNVMGFLVFITIFAIGMYIGYKVDPNVKRDIDKLRKRK